MPIYKYECKSCEHIFEDLRGFNDPNPDECPECGESDIERLISGGNFHLKGSGWYVTDYGDASKARDSSTSSEPAKSSESTSSSDASSADSSGGSSDGTEAA